MSNENPSGFRKFLNFLFNVCWVIFAGIELAFSFIVEGITNILMIIPIFFGIPWVYFNMVPLVFAPAGKTVKLNYLSHPIKNTFYLLFGGFVNVIFCYSLGALLCVTLIGIPLGLQIFKIGKYTIAPFGANVYKYGELVS